MIELIERPRSIAPPSFQRAEVLHWLRSLREDPWYRQFHVIVKTRDKDSMKPLSDACGVSCSTLMFAFRNESGARHGRGRNGVKKDRGMTQRTVDALGPVMRAVEDGRLIFVGGEPVWRIRPRPLPPPQPRLLLREDWRDWARCRTCSGSRWAAIVMGGREHAACWNCVPLDQWPALGAVKAKHQLIAVGAE